ncbi:Na+/solute symporter [Auricularia subglabra TFB-10046 SS5]|nr:Na+/solute symporter [Auricularia subglabra TFB-10046 SS5]
MGGQLASLPQAAGYGVVVGIGFFFALLMAGISALQNRYTRFSTWNSEEFNTASRNVKPGLIASGIVSAWTWAATLLQSCTVAYRYGVAGPFWYAAGGTVQILIFSVLACKVKQNAPKCHTYLEIIYARYGATTHCVFIFFALLTNILVASQLLLGGSAVVTSLTGMNVYAANFLIPVGVCAYVVLGGLRATFLCDYSHTFILMIVMIYFMFNVYSTNDLIGSPTRMYELLVDAAHRMPVEGNTQGSYLTLKSNLALVFGAIQICSGPAAVFLDQAYWQRAIASKPRTAVHAYILGSMAWFAIPFGFATTLGLAGVALVSSPAFPTYPGRPSEPQVSSGLIAALAASALMGTRGAVVLLVVLLMAVTSCASAELIAVSSVLTFDVYKTYLRPRATPAQLIRVSHAMICMFGLTMSVFACLWNAIGIDLGWLFLTMGVLIGGAVFPAAFAITWRGQTAAGAIAGCLVGLAAGVIAWLVTAQLVYGEVTIATTGLEYPNLAGNLGSIVVGLVATLAVSWIWPGESDFDRNITRAINSSMAELETQEHVPTVMELGDASKAKEAHEQPASEDHDHTTDEGAVDLRGALTLAWVSSLVLSLAMDFLIPIPMFLSHYVFSQAFFTAWVVVSFIWVFASAATSCILPVWETRYFFRDLFQAVSRDVHERFH